MANFDSTDPDISYRIIAHNRLAFAFLTNTPIVPGHTLICPKQPIMASGGLTPEIWSDIMVLKAIVCAQLQKVLGAQGFNFAWNEGAVAGQSVPHFHLHVVPRKEHDTGIYQYEPRSFLYRPGSRAESPEQELLLLAQELQYGIPTL